MTYPIRQVTITVTYSDSTDIEGIVDGLLDIPGVEGTFVPSGQSDEAVDFLDALSNSIFGDVK